MTARDQSLDRLVTWRRALLGTTTNSPWAVRTLVTRRVSSSTVPVMPVVWPGTDRRITSPKANWCSAKRKNPASRSPTICWAPKPRPMPITVAGATSVVSGMAQPVEGQDGGDEVGEGHHHPLDRLADGPGPLEALGGDRARLDLAADLGVDPAPATRPDPVGEPDEEPGAQQEHDGREQMVLEPGWWMPGNYHRRSARLRPRAGPSDAGRRARRRRRPVP